MQWSGLLWLLGRTTPSTESILFHQSRRLKTSWDQHVRQKNQQQPVPLDFLCVGPKPKPPVPVEKTHINITYCLDRVPRSKYPFCFVSPVVIWPPQF